MLHVWAYMFEHPAGTCFATWKHNWRIRQHMLLLQSKPLRVQWIFQIYFALSLNFVVTKGTGIGIIFWIHEMQLNSFWALYLYSVLKQCGLTGFYFLLVHLKSIISVAWYILQAKLPWPAEYFHKFLAVVPI